MHVLQLIFPLFVIIFVGYVLRRTGFAPPGFVDELNRLVYFIGLPALLFSETRKVDLGQLAGSTPAVAFPIVVAATALVALGATLLIPHRQRGQVVQAGFRANLAYLGLPIVSTTLGDETLATIAIIIAVGITMNAVAGILVLSLLSPSRENLHPLKRLKSILTNPLLIAIVLGLLFAASGWSLPNLLARPIELLSTMSLPLILLVLGLSLSFSELGRNFAGAALAAVIKLAVMPAIAWLVMRFVFAGPDAVVHTAVLMAAMPTAVVSQSFAKAFEADASISAASVSLSTLLAVLTVPLLVLILGV